MMRCKSTDKIRTSVMYFCKIAISDGNFEKKVNGNECRFSRFSDYLALLGEPVSWITSLRSVFLKCLKSNKEKSSVCNAFFFYETHLIEASFTSVYCIKKVLPERKDFSLCPRLDSNQHTCWHHPLKMACLPISPRGQQTVR